MNPAYAMVDAHTREIKMDPKSGALAIFDTLEAAAREAIEHSTYTSVDVVPVYLSREDGGNTRPLPGRP